MKTRKAFNRAFREIAHLYNWKLVSGKLRGRRKTDKSNSWLACPLTSLYRERFGKIISVNNYDNAARKLGLGLYEADLIVAQADASYEENIEMNEKGRTQLLKAVGLWENK